MNGYPLSFYSLLYVVFPNFSYGIPTGFYIVKRNYQLKESCGISQYLKVDCIVLRRLYDQFKLWISKQLAVKDLLVKIFYTLEKEQSDHTHKLTTVQGKLLRLCLPSSFNQTIFHNLRILSRHWRTTNTRWKSHCEWCWQKWLVSKQVFS